VERKIFITEDGSHSISIPKINGTYHSVHGAVQESKPVFIDFFMLDPGGVLVTYCSKGNVRRALMAAGFSVKNARTGKREILRAVRL
jgi:hypothetical protein